MVARVEGYRWGGMLEARLDDVIADRAWEVRRLSPIFEHIYAERWARVIGAALALPVLLGSFGVLAYEATLSDYSSWPALLLIASWLVFWLANVITRLLASDRFRRALRSWLRPQSYPQQDLARLEEQDAEERAFELCAPVRVKSLSWPLVYVALAGPLGLHLLVALACGVGLPQFSSWMAMSALIVGHAHLVLAALLVGYAQRLWNPVPGGRGYRRILLIVVAVSCLPGLALLAIPPALTFVTGGVLLSMAYVWSERVVRREAAIEVL